jgi:hypothetical protein
MLRRARATADVLDETKGTRSRHGNRDDVKTLAAGLIALARELEDLPDPQELVLLEDRQQRLLDWQRRLANLEPAAIKELIVAINRSTHIRDETRQDLLLLIVQAFAEKHPQETLDLLAEIPFVLANSQARAEAASLALLRCMERSPSAAIEWYKTHRAGFPASEVHWLTEQFLRGTSTINPKFAFSLIGELKLPDLDYAVRMITNPARTAAERDAVLSAFREYLKTIPEGSEREALAFEGNSSLMATARFEGMDKGLCWIEQAGFSQEEVETYVSRTSPTLNAEDTAKWIDWILRTTSKEEITTETVPQLLFGWTQFDHQAAAQWLTALPEGPIKNACIPAYAQVIAPYQPETATRWASTLPPGEARDGLFNSIYQRLLKSDPAAAAVLAEEHGIK